MIQKLWHSTTKNIFQDFGLNLAASMLVTGVSQLIVYPLLAYYMSAEGYGFMLTLMGIASIVAVACGGSLNNTRLLLNADYEEKQCKGDFSVVLLAMAVITSIALALILRFLYIQQMATIVFIILYADLCLARSYCSVEYRLMLDFKKILISNVSGVVGNLIGIVLFILFRKELLWPLPFVGGECVAFIYLLASTRIMGEPLSLTCLFRKMINKESILLVTSISGNILMYLDRLLLLPILGGAAVSVYTVASAFGKTLGILMGPLAGVLLSYYAQTGFPMGRRLFWKINILSLAAGGIFMIGSMFFAAWFIGLLYPLLAAEAEPYILIANATAVVNVAGSMTQPSVLRFAPTIWQLIVQIVYCGIYLFAGMIAVRGAGLWGFSVVVLMASTVKLLLLYLIGHVFIRSEVLPIEW